MSLLYGASLLVSGSVSTNPPIPLMGGRIDRSAPPPAPAPAPAIAPRYRPRQRQPKNLARFLHLRQLAAPAADLVNQIPGYTMPNFKVYSGYLTVPGPLGGSEAYDSLKIHCTWLETSFGHPACQRDMTAAPLSRCHFALTQTIARPAATHGTAPLPTPQPPNPLPGFATAHQTNFTSLQAPRPPRPL